jgi:leader peptidase (prepilin peptidase)/N-methyltransferase
MTSLASPIIDVAVILVGLVMGSAITAIVHRVPRDISWVHGRSACPSCGATLGARDLFPVLSWALALGRCRHCMARVSARYPLTELASGAWAYLLYRHIGLGFDYPFLAIWGFLLIALTLIDFDFQLLPDALTFPGTLMGVAAALQWPRGAREAILGVVVGSGLLWLLAWGYWKLRKVEGMGGGDIKLAAMFGVVLGWQLTLVTLFVAALAGSIWGGILILTRRGDGRTALPFGTLLAPAAMIVFLWGRNWVGAYFAFAFGR